jgi:hypothetical protein
MRNKGHDSNPERLNMPSHDSLEQSRIRIEPEDKAAPGHGGDQQPHGF